MSKFTGTRCMCQLCNHKPVIELESYTVCDLSPERMTELLRKAFDRLKNHAHLKIVVSYEEGKEFPENENGIFMSVLTDDTDNLFIELTRISIETTDEKEREDIIKILDNHYITNPAQDAVFMWFFLGTIKEEEVTKFKLLTEDDIKAISQNVGEEGISKDYFEGDPIPPLAEKKAMPKVIVMNVGGKGDLPN